MTTYFFTAIFSNQQFSYISIYFSLLKEQLRQYISNDEYEFCGQVGLKRARGQSFAMGWILGSAMLGLNQVKKVKRAGKRAIDRLPSHERMALFSALLYFACVAVYTSSFVGRASAECRARATTLSTTK